MNRFGIGDPQALFLCSRIRVRIHLSSTVGERGEPPGTRSSEPLTRILLEVSSRLYPLLRVATTIDALSQKLSVGVVSRTGGRELPYVQEGFFGPGISLIAEAWYRLYHTKATAAAVHIVNAACWKSILWEERCLCFSSIGLRIISIILTQRRFGPPGIEERPLIKCW